MELRDFFQEHPRESVKFLRVLLRVGTSCTILSAFPVMDCVLHSYDDGVDQTLTGVQTLRLWLIVLLVLQLTQLAIRIVMERHLVLVSQLPGREAVVWNLDALVQSRPWTVNKRIGLTSYAWFLIGVVLSWWYGRDSAIPEHMRAMTMLCTLALVLRMMFSFCWFFYMFMYTDQIPGLSNPRGATDEMISRITRFNWNKPASSTTTKTTTAAAAATAASLSVDVNPPPMVMPTVMEINECADLLRKEEEEEEDDSGSYHHASDDNDSVDGERKGSEEEDEADGFILVDQQLRNALRRRLPPLKSSSSTRSSSSSSRSRPGLHLDITPCSTPGQSPSTSPRASTRSLPASAPSSPRGSRRRAFDFAAVSRRLRRRRAAKAAQTLMASVRAAIAKKRGRPIVAPPVGGDDDEEEEEQQQQEEEEETVVGASPVDDGTSGGSDDNCPICLSEFEAGDDMAQLPCHSSHLFHYDCILMWFQQATSCPLCAGDMAESGKPKPNAVRFGAGFNDAAAFGLPLLDDHGDPGAVIVMD